MPIVRLLFPINIIMVQFAFLLLFFILWVVGLLEAAFVTTVFDVSDYFAIFFDHDHKPEKDLGLIFIYLFVFLFSIVSLFFTFSEVKQAISGMYKMDNILLIVGFYAFLSFPLAFLIQHLMHLGIIESIGVWSALGSFYFSIIAPFIFLVVINIVRIFLWKKKVYRAILDYFNTKHLATIEEVSYLLDVPIRVVRDTFNSLINKGLIQSLGGWSITVKEDGSEFRYDVFVLTNANEFDINSIPYKVRMYFSTYCIGMMSDIQKFTDLNERQVLLGIIFLREYNEITLINTDNEDNKIYKWNSISNSPDCFITKVSGYFLARQVGEVSDIISYTGLGEKEVYYGIEVLLYQGDLEVIGTALFKWAHDIEFSEGVETVHLEID